MAERPDTPINTAFLSDVIAGLSQRQKAVPARWFYDQCGSELFEEITRLPEYYPTRTESGILTAAAADLAQRLAGRAVVEFGSGSSEKTPLLLAACQPLAYVPIDISGDFLRSSAAALQADFPQLPVLPVEADFMQPVSLPEEIASMPCLGFFPGSTIGNLVPPSAVDLLRSMRQTLGHDGLLLIGMDRIKPTDMLLRAYDDGAGVTARFNLNLLERINRELGADIPLADFVHAVRWDAPFSRIEMHLIAQRTLSFSVAGHLFAMAAGESIHTENSHKYDDRDADLLLLAGGWTPIDRWSDANRQMMLILAQASECRTAP
jgi:dimethylhistidine N-methyltransferase